MPRPYNQPSIFKEANCGKGANNLNKRALGVATPKYNFIKIFNEIMCNICLLCYTADIHVYQGRTQDLSVGGIMRSAWRRSPSAGSRSGSSPWWGVRARPPGAEDFSIVGP